MRFRSSLPAREVHDRLLDYPTLATLIRTGLLTVDAERCAIDQFARNKHSGKTPQVIDNRSVVPPTDLQGMQHEHKD